MKSLGRLFIVIWTIIFTALGFLGGFILFPLLTYVFTGRCDDPMETMFNIWDIGKDGIEKFFNNMKKIFHSLHINFNGGFWK